MTLATSIFVRPDRLLLSGTVAAAAASLTLFALGSPAWRGCASVALGMALLTGYRHYSGDGSNSVTRRDIVFVLAFAISVNLLLSGPRRTGAACTPEQAGSAHPHQIAVFCPQFPETLRGFAVAPSGKHFIMQGKYGSTLVADASSGAHITNLASAPGNQVPVSRLSSDGRRLLSLNTGNAIITEVATSKIVRSIEIGEPVTLDGALSPNGRRLILSRQNMPSRLIDVDTGADIADLDDGDRDVGRQFPYPWPPSFDPTGTRIAVAGQRNASIADAETGRRLLVLAPGFPTFDRSGRYILLARRDMPTAVLDAATGALRFTLAPDNRSVVVNATGTRAVTFSGPLSRGFTSSDHSIATLWDMETGQPITALPGHNKIVMSADFSADGRHLATTTKHAIKFWDAETGAPLATVDGLNGTVGQLLFVAADSRIIFTTFGDAVRLWANPMAGTKP
jgi:WD40 repeat protein